MPVSKGLAQIRKEKRKIVGFIGGYLISDGALTLEQLDRGILRQMHLAEEGRVTKLGQVLIDMGYITEADLRRAMARRTADQAKLTRRGTSKRK